MFKIVTIEDDTAISKLLFEYFVAQNYKIAHTSFGSKAIKLIIKEKPDIILLDWMLNDLDGIHLIKKIRELNEFKTIPIIMLTAKSKKEDVIQGLNQGADDYLSKPFSLAELNARIQSLLRRAHGFDKEGEIRIGEITINPTLYQLKIKKENVKINLHEFRLLHFLAKHKNVIFNRTQLLDAIWGKYAVIDERTIDVNILRIRKILKKYSIDKKIETIRGMGYRLID